MIVTLLFPLAAQAATLEVCATCTYTSVGAAVAAASSGDTIEIAAGVYDETDVVMEMSLTLIGAGSDLTTLRSTSDQVLYVRETASSYEISPLLTLSGLRLEPLSGTALGINHARADLTDVVVEGASDAAISAWYADVTVQGCTFVDNETAIWFGSGMGGDLTVSNSLFQGSASSAIYADANVTVTNSVFDRNASASHGGAIDAFSSVHLEGNTFSRNVAGGGGGAVASGLWPMTLTRNLFCDNEAGYGGAVASFGNALVGSGNVFAHNGATSAGGDLYLVSDDIHTTTALLVNNTFVGGQAPAGGSLWVDGELDFRSNIVAYTSEYGLYVGSWAPILAYNDFWEVAPDAVGGTWAAPDSTNLSVDPMFVNYMEGGCDRADFSLLPESALVDAGDPWTGDGTTADIGATGASGEPIGLELWYRDADGDGYGVPDEYTYGYGQTAPAGYVADTTDCDDEDPTRHPGRRERCDGIDQDCDDIIDESAWDAPVWRRDRDGDGFQGADENHACEQPDEWEPVSGETDCDDRDATAYPGAVDICGDEVDQDCDGTDNDPRTWRRDADGDGYQASEKLRDCEQPEGWEKNAGPPYDCDDDNPDTHPGAFDDPSDRIDQDCDGHVVPLAATPDDGCRGCSPGPDPSWLALALGLAAVRMSRRPPATG